MPTTPASKGSVAGDGQGARVLVVGCGFIGSHVAAELTARDRPPIVLTRSLPGEEVVRTIEPGDLHVGDGGDPVLVERLLEGVGQIVYCAGGLLPARSQEDPELDARLTFGPLRGVLEALHKRPDVKLTYISSGGTVYGDPDRLPVDELAPSRPQGTYGELHLACEREIERCRDEQGVSARILRCATVYGERQHPDRGQGVIPTFLHRISHDLELDLYGGSTVRDYIYVGDVARAVVDLLDRENGEPLLNVGSGEGTSLNDLLHMIERQVGHPAIVNRHPARDFEVQKVVLDITRLRRLIDFEPTPLATGIERTHRWLTARAAQRV